MPRNIPKSAKVAPGPFIIVDANDQPLRDERGAIREFSTEKRASVYLRPGERVVHGNR